MASSGIEGRWQWPVSPRGSRCRLPARVRNGIAALVVLSWHRRYCDLSDNQFHSQVVCLLIDQGGSKRVEGGERDDPLAPLEEPIFWQVPQKKTVVVRL